MPAMVRLPLWLLMVCTLALAGCGDAADGGAVGEQEQRIVTLAPAVSQMLMDLGVGDRIVGVGENDMAAPPGVPIVGHFTDVNTEALLKVRPTHVFAMSASAGPPPRLRDMAAAGQFQFVDYGYPRDLGDVLDVLAPADGAEPIGPPTLGEVVGEPDAASALRRRIEQQLQQLAALTSEQDSPRVLMVIGVDPLMASGPGTVHDELLAYAGGSNAIASGGTAVTFDREALVALQPDVILLLQPGAPPLRENDPRLASLRGLPIPAVQNNRIVLLNDPLVLLPSTSLVHIAGQMAAAIHPELSQQIETILSADAPAAGATHE